MSRIVTLVEAANKLPEQDYRNCMTSGASELEIKNKIKELKNMEQNKRFNQAREENRQGSLEDFGGGELQL